MQEYDKDELTLKELILKLHEYFWEIVKSWWMILLICLITSGIYIKKHYDHKVTHRARLLFSVEGQGVAGGEGALASIIGGLGGATSRGTNPYKILEVAYGSEFFTKLINTKSSSGELISNLILKEHDLVDEWVKISPKFEGFRFEEIPIDKSGNRLQYNGFRRLQKFVWGTESNRTEALTTIELDFDTGIYNITTNARTEELSLLITNTAYKELKFFFEEELFRNQQQIARILNTKADSLQAARDYKIRELARFENRNRSIIGKSVIAERTILTMEQQAINQAYGEVLRSKEMTDVTNQDRKPLFVAVDRPYAPLPVKGSNLIKEIIMALIVGGFISILIILLRKIYRDIMS